MNVKEINIKDVVIVENSRLNIKNLEGLMQDIKHHGLKQPIGVSSTAKANEYVLVFGHRRLSACKKLGWKKIPANVYENIEIQDILINNLAENIHREDTTPLELGRICDRLKTMDLTESEIAIKLSIPVSKVKGAIDAYKGIPAKYKHKVVYMDSKMNRNKGGNISATVAALIIRTKRAYGLSDTGFEKMLSAAKQEEMTSADLAVVSQLMKQGLTVTQALAERKKYSNSRFDAVLNKEELEQKMKEHGIDSSQAYLLCVVYGLVPPLKKPDFINLSQLPDKK
jgi:ParB/RepB/Spo0J family partition protein